MDLSIVIWIVLGGGIGGLANALLADGGFKGIHKETLPNGQNILLPGCIGNVFIGIVAGLMMWVIYGNLNLADERDLLRAVVGAFVAGAGGGRIITSEIDKRLLLAANGELAAAVKPKKREK